MIARRISGALLGGALMLLAEIRFEHREVLGETWRGWIPLGFLALLLAVGGPAWLKWRSGGRKVLSALFAGAIVVGAAGFWFHSGGRPARAMQRIASAWSLKPGDDGGEKPGGAPPALAPLAFVGLGLLGVLACASDPMKVVGAKTPQE